MNSLQCDPNGVPRLILDVWYNVGLDGFRIKFFNGKEKVFARESVCPGMKKGDELVLALFLCAVSNVEKLAETKWKQWFPCGVSDE